MRLLHVGGDLDVAADTNCERLVYEPQPVEVGFGKIGVDGGLDPFSVKQGVDVDVAVEQFVGTTDSHGSSSVFQDCLCSDVVQVPVAVLQLGEFGISRQVAAVGEEVCAVALGLDVCRDGVERVFGHEMMQVELVHLDGGIVAHILHSRFAFRIEGNDGREVHLHITLSLAQHHLCIIVRTVGFQGSV